MFHSTIWENVCMEFLNGGALAEILYAESQDFIQEWFGSGAGLHDLRELEALK